MGIAAMVIDSNNINSSSGAPRNRVDTNAADTQKSSSDASGTKAETSAKPEVSLSSQAQTLSRLESSIQSVSDVDSDRVAEIKKAIADGSFKIDADSIADRMLTQDELFR